jgi:hypothetical protein
MSPSMSKRIVNDADSHYTKEARCAPQPSSPVDVTPMRPRALVVTSNDEMGDLVHHALEGTYDVNRHPIADDPLDRLLGDVEVAILDSSILGQIVPPGIAEDRKHAARPGSPISGDLTAVQQLGTILKYLSSHWRSRRRSIN